jgi:4-amino-4-deoxy-L-arabinose transferase-like glycosyltransferase
VEKIDETIGSQKPEAQKPLTTRQRRRDLLLLLALGLLVRAITAALFDQPGYIDAAYYYDVARNLVTGHGFTEDFILIYLTPAASIVHTSNLYWMPLASLVLVPFFAVFGVSWRVAEIPNVLLSGTLPLLAYWMGWDMFRSRRYALGAALLTLCAGFYYPLYFIFSDNFGLYAWTAGLALLFIGQGARGRSARATPVKNGGTANGSESAATVVPASRFPQALRAGGRPRRFILAGFWIGLAHLARPDAPLLLVIALIIFAGNRYLARRANASKEKETPQPGATALPWYALGGLIGCYLVVMAPWFARNLMVTGAILPPGGTKTIWLTTYNDFFSYGKDLSPHTYLAWGLGNILLSKLQALGQNGFAILAMLEFAPAPFAALGMWKLRRSPQAQPFLLYFVLLYLGLSLVFTFPSLRGTLLHSFVPLLPFMSLAIILGLDTVIDWLARRRPGPAGQRRAASRRRVYLAATILLSGVLSCVIIFSNASTWDTTYHLYQQAGKVAAQQYACYINAAAHNNGQNAPESALPIVMVSDPPDYYLATGQHAVSIPDQDIEVILQVADRYDAAFLLLEPLHSAIQDPLWEQHVHSPRLTLIWSTSQGQLYRIVSNQRGPSADCPVSLH